MLRFFTAGESHGEALTAIVDGMVAGLKVKEDAINEELSRRQQGYGRGGRMRIETDKIHFTSGLRSHVTIGSPLTLIVPNKDFVIDRMPSISNPRPGHADLAGVLKYDRKDVRDILERASARETAVRVAVGALCKIFLREFDIHVASHVVSLGRVTLSLEERSFEKILKSDASPVRCIDKATEEAMMREIDEAKSMGTSVGGVVEVLVKGVPVGLGSHTQWDRKLDGNIARGLMSMQAIKGVEFGEGFTGSQLFGHQLHDEILHSAKKGMHRKTNRAGGIEGGMSNGELIVVKAAMKPLSTLRKPLKTVDIHTKESKEASFQRTDTCAVPAAGVVGEAIVAFEIAAAMLEKFGGDSLKETKRNFKTYVRQVEKRQSKS